jgi:hypothetical protein
VDRTRGRRNTPRLSGYALLVDTALGILVVVVSLTGVVGVAIAFVWAARKDGEQDEATQRRLGIRRRTRLGR